MVIKFSKEQVDWIDSFNRIHFPDSKTSLPDSEFSEFSVPAGRSIFGENPGISRIDFDKEMESRMKLIYGFSRSFIKRFPKLPHHFTYKFFDQSLDTRMPFREQVRAYQLTTKFLRYWLKEQPAPLGEFIVRRGDSLRFSESGKSYELLGKFVISHNVLVHDETPLALCISSLDGQLLASIGGYLYFDRGKLAIHITNIQGSRREPWTEEDGIDRIKFKNRVREHIRNYYRLNAFFGKDWRDFFIREIVRIAEKKGFGLTGEIHHTQLKERERTTKKYRETYERTGFVFERENTWRRLHPRRK